MTTIILILVFSIFSFAGGFFAGVKNASSAKVKPFIK